MKERPILMSGPMVKAILEGRKTQTRRVVKPRVKNVWHSYPGDRWWVGPHPNGNFWAVDIPSGPPGWMGKDSLLRGRQGFPCPYGVPGDRLWVREAHVIIPGDHMKNRTIEEALVNGPSSPLVMYPATDRIYKGEKKRPSIHMPRWASRINLEVVNVRVERLQEITEEDAIKEGVEYGSIFDFKARPGFIQLWDSINGKKCPWNSNPWVWVVEFKRK